MKRAISIFSLTAILFAPVAVAQQGDVSYKSTELVPGIVMLQGVGGFTGGNLALWTGEDGVVLVDDGMPPYFAKMLAAIREHVAEPVDFVINTHVHGDHVGNNEGLSEQGATIFAHDNIRKRMLTDGVGGPDGNTPPSQHMLPEVTFSNEVTIHLNGHRAQLIHVPHAHTDGDSIVHFPDVDVIHAGDVLFNGLFPYIDLKSGGSVDGFIAALERVLALAGQDTKIISGHGPLATKADVEAARDMLVTSRDRVRKRVLAGESEDEIVAANPLADYDEAWTWGFITTERMTRALVQDAAGRND